MVPKAELHVHLEGTAPPHLIRRIAARNGLTVPDGVFAAPDRFAWRDFLDFLQTYDMAASVIRNAEDYRDITYEYLRGCAAEGAVYVELIASPDHAALVGLSDAEHLGGIAAGIDAARAEHGIEARILLTCIRNFGVESAVRIARHAAERPGPRRSGPPPTSSASRWRATRPATRPARSPRRTRSRPTPASAAAST